MRNVSVQNLFFLKGFFYIKIKRRKTK